MNAVIRTSSGSRYLLEGKWLTRLVEYYEPVDYAPSAKLRRDGEALEIVEALDPVVGCRWDMLIRVREDGFMTYRSTTPVVEIQSVDWQSAA